MSNTKRTVSGKSGLLPFIKNLLRPIRRMYRRVLGIWDQHRFEYRITHSYRATVNQRIRRPINRARGTAGFIRRSGFAPHEQQLIIDQFRTDLLTNLAIGGSEIAGNWATYQKNDRSFRERAQRHFDQMTKLGPMVAGRPTGALEVVANWTRTRPDASLVVEADDLHDVRPNRFNFLPFLAMAAVGRPDAVKAIGRILDAWNDSLLGGNCQYAYASPLTVTSRLISFFYGFLYLSSLTRESRDGDVLWKLVQFMGRDVVFLEDYKDRIPANNHRVVYSFIRWFSVTLLPSLSCVESHGQAFEAAFASEVTRQFQNDGTGIEPALHYQQFGLECASLFCVIKKWRNQKVDPRLLASLQNMLIFRISLSGVESCSPRIGDDSNHELFPVSEPGVASSAIWREIYRSLFDGTLPPVSGESRGYGKAFWFLLGRMTPAVEQRRANDPALSIFATGGFCVFTDEVLKGKLVLRSAPSTQAEVFPGHMHVNFNSIYLTCEDQEVIVDSGTYTYRSFVGPGNRDTPNWRKYFAGASAKNGLFVSGVDVLALDRQDFHHRDIEVPRAEMHCWCSGSLSLVESRLSSQTYFGGTTRTVIHVIGEYWLIYDELPPEFDCSNARYGLQFSPVTNIVRGTENGFEADTNGSKVRISYSGTRHQGEIHLASTNPVGGWVSEVYGVKIPAPQLVFAPDVNGRGSGIMIEPRSERAGSSRFRMTSNQMDHAIFEYSDATRRDIVIINKGNNRLLECSDTLRFAGKLLWMRKGRDHSVQIRALSCLQIQDEGSGLDVGFAPGTASFELKSG